MFRFEWWFLELRFSVGGRRRVELYLGEVMVSDLRFYSVRVVGKVFIV